MQTDQLSHTFSALADPTRRAILASLAKGDANVQTLASPFDMSLPAISKHLKVLERAGLIERGRDAQYRPCRLRADGLKLAASWLEHYRRFWEESFDRMEIFLRDIQNEQKPVTRVSNESKRPSRRRSKGKHNVGRKQKHEQ